MQDFDDQEPMHLDTAVHPEKIHPTAFIAQGAIVVGDVTLGEDVGVWFNSTLRGDVEAIVVGPQTNIQEGCILHADPGYPCVIGDTECTAGLLLTVRANASRTLVPAGSSTVSACIPACPRNVLLRRISIAQPPPTGGKMLMLAFSGMMVSIPFR